MKKKLLVASLFVAGAATLSAQDARESAFIGIEVGSTSFDIKAENQTFAGNNSSESDSGGTYNVKLGKYLGEAGRVYGIVGVVNADDATITTYGVGYDYLVYNDSPVTPFVGATLGYQQIDIDDSTLDLSGLTYGLEIGAQYAVNKNVDLEAGYRRNFSSNDDTLVILGQSIKATVENTGVWYIGANYNF